jgi:hypothetical protein
MALPLIALSNSDVKLRLHYNKIQDSVVLEKYYKVVASGRLMTKALVNYVHLDSDERRKFAQFKHEYLIENVQYAPEQVLTRERNEIELGFINCCKDLLWRLERVVPEEGPEEPILQAWIELNGVDRISAADGDYFNTVVPYEFYQADTTDDLYAYSFALRPNAIQPSGSCNMSMFETKRLVLIIRPEDVGKYRVRIYARSYNLLRIMGGQGGLTHVL